jgi:type I restriction enzyme S subunit
MQKDFYSYIMSNAYAASVTSVRKPMLINYPIPIPPLSEQQRIVSILDTFEASIHNLEQQLAQREKQYEYYRNKLLTFE